MAEIDINLLLEATVVETIKQITQTLRPAKVANSVRIGGSLFDIKDNRTKFILSDDDLLTLLKGKP